MKIVYGPEKSFYDEREDSPEFSIGREEDGLFFQFLDSDGKQVACCTLVEPQLQRLLKVIKKELKRLS
jgi:hypothetical protein